MTCANLSIDLSAVLNNWRALDAKTAASVETAAVIKADAYGLGAGKVAASLSKAGVKTFFVALAEEGVEVRKAIGNIGDIFVFSGMMLTDAKPIKDYNLIPLLNAAEQVSQFRANLPEAQFGIQLDSGMNRLGMEPAEFAQMKDIANDASLIISHLACADTPKHPQNRQQLTTFHEMTNGLTVRKSLAATGGILLGSDYHFDLCRPGIGLYGGAPYEEAKAVVSLDIPVIQTRDVAMGESVGYGANWVAKRNSRIATLAAGYADGLIRAMGNGDVFLYHADQRCPLVGRVSMDLLTVDVTDLEHVPDVLQLLNSTQTVDHLADAAQTIGYELLTSLGARYKRSYIAP